MTLTLTPLTGIPLIRPGDNLSAIILSALDLAGICLENGDIIVVAQKVVSKVEGRHVNLTEITPSQRAFDLAKLTEKDPRLVELILRESREVLRVRPGTIIVEHRLGFICASAGIDHSNVDPDFSDIGNQLSVISFQQSVAVENTAELESTAWVLLLPENPDLSADCLRHELEQASGARLGVLIIDSHGRAWRLGTVGMAIGVSGMPALVDLRGQPDLFGYRLQITQVGAADELAAAASLVMGQASEGTPVVHARGFPYPLQESSLKDMIRPNNQDMFR